MTKVEKIKSLITIRELAERYGAQPNSKGKCKYNPIREEKTSSLQIYDETNSFNDFGGVGGDVIDFYAEYHKISIIEAIENLVKDLNINLEDERVYQQNV